MSLLSRVKTEFVLIMLAENGVMTFGHTFETVRPSLWVSTYF